MIQGTTIGNQQSAVRLFPEKGFLRETLFLCVARLIYQCEISRYQGRNSQQIGKFRAIS
ncbi:hypothetical protein MICAC_4280007 [Microcystis aeruginosa PCC 9443]|uniref:Uncharacterized protein n=1 Tax=Microcystis aeruginosa PCC 9443 TaxID=1160281 RepID=I4G5M3_MICAE|nr:hypothetical protein MICAC_4280007 [Microcystis aeruginosa PCC 9443]